jgi:hypothetical protein
MLRRQRQEVPALPMVHACERDDCDVLTMGRLCLEHERQEQVPSRGQSVARLATAFVLVAAGVAGATLRARFVR